jgi:nucleolar protein 58
LLGHAKKSTLAVADSKLGNLLKDKYDIQCVNNLAVMELFRGIRSQMNSLITGKCDDGMILNEKLMDVIV